jgi:large subunit ribosomal protein L13
MLRVAEMKTQLLKKGEVDRKWYVADATGQTLGRLAVKVATVLMGKHKPTFTPHVDSGDFVIVVNAEKIKVTGKKMEKKRYIHHTQWPGGYSETALRDLRKTKPGHAVRLAVKRMLPKTRLGDRIYSKLKVYTGSDHPHTAQQPVPLQ